MWDKGVHTFHENENLLLIPEMEERQRVKDMVMVNISNEYVGQFSHSYQVGACKIRWSYGLMVLLSPRNFKNMVPIKLNTNCPITVDGVITSNKIYGPIVCSLKWK